MGTISPESIRRHAREYRDREPLAGVEADRLASLPSVFRDGRVLWRDCAWVIRWYGRRSLDGTTHPAEETFRGNRMAEIERALGEAIAGDSTRERIDVLCRLEGVDVPIASAFLQFIAPDQYAAVAERCWRALAEAGILEGNYPDPVRPGHFERYTAECQTLARRADLAVVTVGQALWRIGGER